MIITSTGRLRVTHDLLGIDFEGVARFEKDTETGLTTVTWLEVDGKEDAS